MMDLLSFLADSDSQCVCVSPSTCRVAFASRRVVVARTMKICSNQCVCGVRVWVILILNLLALP